MSATIVVVDYGAGNLTSVVRGLNAAGATVRIASSPRDLAGADGLVVPGVGHFGATATLGSDWRRAILAHVGQCRPLLGICLGMQWLFEGCDEAPDVSGLGLFRGRCARLRGNVKIPHAGWNTLERAAPSRLLDGTGDQPWAYFTHAYAPSANAGSVVATTTHGLRFAAVVERGAVFGTQYHPEKSGADGMRQLVNFVAIARALGVAPNRTAAVSDAGPSGMGKRLIACLDVRDGQVVKGVQFEGLRDAGDPAALARRYNEEGIDELVLLDVTATIDARRTLLSTVTAVSRELSIPFTVGGGIRSRADAKAVIEAGADKVSLNTAALREPALLTDLASVYGSQAIVVAIDAKRDGEGYRVFSRSGTSAEARDAVDWAREAADRGAGEILLTSIDRDGTRAGFDCALTAAVSDAVPIPVIASGGAGAPDHFVDVFTAGRADAALAASVFHFSEHAVRDLKAHLSARGVPVRPVAGAREPKPLEPRC